MNTLSTRALIRATFVLAMPLFASRASAEWSYEDRVLTRCDEAWFKEILESQRFLDFLDDRIDRSTLDPIELAKLAMVEAFVWSPSRPWDIALTHSNPYAAATLYACLQRHFGHPGQGHSRWSHDFAEKYPPASAIDLEAAFMAHVRDEPSFHMGTIRNDVLLFLKSHGPILDNMYAAYAEGLAERNQPYMVQEWTRLTEFQNNPEVKVAALKALTTGVHTNESRQFSWLVADIQRLYERAGTKRFLVRKGNPHRLPAPHEDMRIDFGDPPSGSLSLADNQVVIAPASVHQGDRLALPTVEGRGYTLVVDTPCTTKYCNFLIMPTFGFEWRTNRLATLKEKKRLEQEEFQAECLDQNRVNDREYLAAFAGTYVYVCTCPAPHTWPLSRRPKLEVALQGELLVAQFPSARQDENSPLTPCRGDEFTLSAYPERRMRFVKNPDGSVTALESLRGKPHRRWIRDAK